MIDKGKREFGQDNGVTPLLFTRSAMGFLLTTESKDLGLTSHRKDGVISPRASNFLETALRSHTLSSPTAFSCLIILTHFPHAYTKTVDTNLISPHFFFTKNCLLYHLVMLKCSQSCHYSVCVSITPLPHVGFRLENACVTAVMIPGDNLSSSARGPNVIREHLILRAMRAIPRCVRCRQVQSC